MATVKPATLVVSHHDVMAADRSSALAALTSCIASPEDARAHFEGLDIAFDGYDHDSREVFEIPEVRAFVNSLDADFPFWLFFMSKRSLGLQAITLCFMPTNLTPEERQKTFPEVLNRLLTDRWLPAMNEVCAYCGYTEDEIAALADRSLDYMRFGPEPFCKRTARADREHP